MSLSKLTKGIAGFLAILAMNTAIADDASNVYWGLMGGQGDATVKKSSSAVNIKQRLSGGALVLGYELSSALSTELRLGRVTGDSTAQSAYGYFRFAYPTSNVKAYLLLGAGVTDINAKSNGSSVNLSALNIDEPNVSAGLGVALFGNAKTALVLEMVTQASDDISLPMYSVGFQHYFGGHK